MKARYLGSVLVEEYKYSNKDRHLLKGLTTRGCEANEGKIFRIGSTTTSMMYNIINNIFNNNYVIFITHTLTHTNSECFFLILWQIQSNSFVLHDRFGQRYDAA